MAQRRGDDGRVGGMGLAARFSLTMTLALFVVMAVTGYLLYDSARTISSRALEDGLIDASRAMTENERNLGDPSSPGPVYRTKSQQGKAIARTGVERWDIEFRYGSYAGQDGLLYQTSGEHGVVIVPGRGQQRSEKNLVAMFGAVTVLVSLVGAAVAYAIASQVTKPIRALVDDVRTISRGNLHHRVRARAGGEVGLLAKAVDRMAANLAEAQEAEIELGMREREIEVAREVRAALLPHETPALPGYEIADLHVGAAEPGGDFHDYIFRGRETALLVCEVEGGGVPGALVGATARAYLRNELERGTPLEEALAKVNRDLARDVRRGMAVTALCLVVDAVEHVATLACAGHRLPLIRYSAADGQVRTLQPEGIALGFDAGPVFERRLEILQVPLEPGDRLLLGTTGVVAVQDAAGAEFGEKALYTEMKRAGKLGPEQILRHLEATLESWAGDEPFPRDISLLVVGREGEA